jgi:flagellar export protein FliJ
MSGLDSLVKLATHRQDNALVSWQQLRLQCQQALTKLAVLSQHRDRYQRMLRGGLEEGMSAVGAMAFLGFIRQIDEVVGRQRAEVGRIEAACARQWELLVASRREKRLYEIVRERAAARELAAALRHSKAEIDDLLQRAAVVPVPTDGGK